MLTKALTVLLKALVQKFPTSGMPPTIRAARISCWTPCEGKRKTTTDISMRWNSLRHGIRRTPKVTGWRPEIAEFRTDPICRPAAIDRSPQLYQSAILVSSHSPVLSPDRVILAVNRVRRMPFPFVFPSLLDDRLPFVHCSASANTRVNPFSAPLARMYSDFLHNILCKHRDASTIQRIAET